jgi:hypothetical protein
MDHMFLAMIQMVATKVAAPIPYMAMFWIASGQPIFFLSPTEGRTYGIQSGA